MKTEIETTGQHPLRGQLRPAPSLRVPVTAGNREFLRWLRAAELTAWEAGRAGTVAVPEIFDHGAMMATLQHH